MNTKTKINDVVELCYKASLNAGWHTDLATGKFKERNKAEMICLIHSELSEAMEGERKNLMDDHLPDRPMAEVEMAEKMDYNSNRKDHKIENRLKDGGKQF